jgi:uncharacterized protein
VPMMAAALSTYVAGVQQIVVAGTGDRSSSDAFASVLARQYVPFAITLRIDADYRDAWAALLPFVAEMRPIGGRAAVYVCRDFACRQPATTAEALEHELRASA